MIKNKCFFLYSLTIFLLCNTACSWFKKVEKDDPNLVYMRAGVGYTDLQIGMTTEQVKSVVGGVKVENRSYEKEYQTFDQSGYKVDSLLQFKVGFDTVWILEKCKKYPLYKLYFKNDTLRFMISTSFGNPFSVTDKIRLGKKIKFYQPIQAVEREVGKPNYMMDFANYSYQDYVYWQKGLQLTFSGDVLRVISVFKPLEKDVMKK